MKKSAGILLYKIQGNKILIFLVHPGGPLWKNKDLEAWSIPKGEFTDDEEPLSAAIREFQEETGQVVKGDFIELQPVTLKSGKRVFAWALEHDLNACTIISNIFQMEWPPKSGNLLEFPEIDRAGWFQQEEAFQKINPGQKNLISQLAEIIKLKYRV